MADSDAVILSRENVVEEWEAQKDREKAAADGRVRINSLFGYLRAIGKSHWIPEGAETVADNGNGTSATTKRAESRPTWTSEVMRALEQYPEGATNEQVREIIKDGPIADRLRTNPNGYYNGVKRLETTNELIRHKGRLFAKHHYDAFMERVNRGEVEDVSDAESYKTSDVLVDYIDRHPEGVEPKQIVRDLVRDRSVVSSGSVYNTLSKLYQKGRVRREGSLYYPLKDSEPPEGGSTVTGSEVAPSLLNPSSGNG